MNRLKLAAAGLAIVMTTGCGGAEENPGQPSAEERQKLDNIAAKADEDQTFDTSADSLVPAGNAAEPPVPSNVSTDGTVMGDNVAAMNSSAPR